MINAWFKHDCEKCVFIPRSFRDGDAYICQQGGVPTLIWRYGNSGEDYQSIPLDVIWDKYFKTVPSA